MDKQKLIKGFKDSIEQAEYYVDYLQDDEQQKAEWLIRLEERKNALFFAEQLPDTQEPCEMQTTTDEKGHTDYRCSNCNENLYFCYDKNFCPNCGRKLEVNNEV